jgi:CheY-like chemotaxis protein
MMDKLNSAPPMQPNKKTSAERRRLSILVADDSVDTVLTLAAILRDEGHGVHTCANSIHVTEAIRRYKPDVCILDIVMPGKTGLSIAREVRAMRLGERPVLIAISGVFDKPGDEIIAKSAGFDYFVPKAAEPAELLRVIDEATEGPAAA